MTTSPPEPPVERRLHPAGIALGSAKAVGSLLLPLVFVMVLGANRGGLVGSLMGAALAVVAAIVLGIVNWATTTYAVTPDRITLRTGLVSRSEQLVPRSRISAIDTVQGPLQRLFDVVELRVQASGGGEAAEVVLSAVSHEEAQAIRTDLGHPAAPRAHDADWSLSPRALILAAVTGPQVGMLVPVLAGVAAFYGDASDAGVRGDALTGLLPGGASGIVLGIAVLALAAMALSVGGAILVFGAFEVWRDGRRLRIRRGLLQRRIATIPLSRIHAVRIVENPVRQALGLATVRIETTAHAGEDAVEQTLVPLVRRDRVAETVAALVPSLPVRVATRSSRPRRGRGAATRCGRRCWGPRSAPRGGRSRRATADVGADPGARRGRRGLRPALLPRCRLVARRGPRDPPRTRPRADDPHRPHDAAAVRGGARLAAPGPRRPGDAGRRRRPRDPRAGRASRRPGRPRPLRAAADRRRGLARDQ